MIAIVLKASDWLRHRGRLRQQNAAHALGRRGEDLAHRYLEHCGLRVIARNYRARSGNGEIDLVAREGDILVFVEVKSRASDEFGSPERAVGEAKKGNMLRAAREFVRRSDADPALVRFDLVSVVFTTPPAISHWPDVLATRETASAWPNGPATSSSTT